VITTRNMKKLAGMALLSGSLGLASLSMGAGTAQGRLGPIPLVPRRSDAVPTTRPAIRRPGGARG
jgi:hypothetical protein